MVCKCPRGAALETIQVSDCPETFGQIQKTAIQRLYKTDGTANGFSTNISLKASWTPFLAAEDDTKIVITPYINAPTAEAGAARTFGGGNETLSGIEEIVGTEPTPFTGVLRKVPQSIIKSMKSLMCESIGVYLFDEHGNIGAVNAGTAEAPIYRPIPIRSFFVSDKTLGGYDAPDSNNIQWSFIPGWSDDLVIVPAADFNPLSDLRPVAPVAPVAPAPPAES